VGVVIAAPARPPEGRGAPPLGAANEVSVGVVIYSPDREALRRVYRR
jgi:hypothetical protein